MDREDNVALLNGFNKIKEELRHVSMLVTTETDPEVSRKLAMINWEVNEAIDILEKGVRDDC